MRDVLLALAGVGLMLSAPGVVSGQPGTASSEALQKRFAREAPRGWAELNKWNESIEVRGTIDESQDDRKIRTGTIRYSRNGDGMLAEESTRYWSPPSAGGKGLFALNRDYGFWVQQKTDAAPWVLQHIDIGGPEKGIILREIRTRYFFVYAPHSHFDPDRPFSDLANDKDFRWTGYEVVSREGRELVKASYEWSRKWDRYPEPTRYEGYILFDPENHWACVEKFMRVLTKQRGLGVVSLRRVTYGEPMVGPVRPFRKAETFEKWVDDTAWGKDSYRLTFTVTHIGHPDADESAYKLSGYGLPEVLSEPPVRARSRLWLWLVGAAAVCALLSVVVRWRWRRQPVTA